MKQQIRVAEGDTIRHWQRRIQDIMDEMRNRSFCDYRTSGNWLPTVNIYETRSIYFVCLELAGLDPDQISLACPDGQHLRISGERPRPRFAQLPCPFSVELMEIDEGPFFREIDFKEPIDTNRIELCYETGFLWISLQKALLP